MGIYINIDTDMHRERWRHKTLHFYKAPSPGQYIQSSTIPVPKGSPSTVGGLRNGD